IERYLQTGDYDLYYRAWPEGGILHRAQMMEAVLLPAMPGNIGHNLPFEDIAQFPALRRGYIHYYSSQRASIFSLKFRIIELR
ncbi:MAG: hypothetical protein P8Y80_09645, partial [Acidobacteriota bacterium]